MNRLEMSEWVAPSGPQERDLQNSWPMPVFWLTLPTAKDVLTLLWKRWLVVARSSHRMLAIFRGWLMTGETGFVVPRGNQALLIDRLGCLLRDPSLCLRMGQKGRAKAERLFKLERLVSETLEVYRRAGWKGRMTAGGILLRFLDASSPRESGREPLSSSLSDLS